MREYLVRGIAHFAMARDLEEEKKRLTPEFPGPNYAWGTLIGSLLVHVPAGQAGTRTLALRALAALDAQLRSRTARLGRCAIIS